MTRRPQPRAAFAGLALALLAAAPAGALGPEPGAAPTSGPMSGPEILAAFTGSTVSGRYATGGAFSEYHAPDGRALGDAGAGVGPNDDACWNVEGDAVCYLYGRGPERRKHCFGAERAGRTVVLRARRDGEVGPGRINAIAAVEPGNPRGHGDGGRAWTCEANVAQGRATRRRAG